MEFSFSSNPSRSHLYIPAILMYNYNFSHKQLHFHYFQY
jgi:hypothetical protein